MSKVIVLLTVLLLAVGAFGRTNAAELNQHCKSLQATGPAVYSIDRNSDLGFCLGYFNAVMDSFDSDAEIEVVKDLIVGDMITSFQRYAPQHYAEEARKAVVNAMIADGFLKRIPHAKN